MCLIIVAVFSAILETEPTISGGRELLFDNLELAIGITFLVEYVARLWIAVENPKFAKSRFPRLRYALTPIAIIDLLAVLPTLFAFGGGSSLLLRFFRVLRMLRLAKLGRSSQAWDHIRNAAYEKRYEFGLILGLLVVTILVSSSLMYWAEADAQPDKFGSIPRALWWSIVTLTTVGYGDVYPGDDAGARARCLPGDHGGLPDCACRPACSRHPSPRRWTSIARNWPARRSPRNDEIRSKFEWIAQDAGAAHDGTGQIRPE